MKQTFTNPDGTTSDGPRLWGVTFVGAQNTPRSFCDKEGNFNEGAWERAMETRTDVMLNGGLDPMQNIRRAYYLVQIRALGKVRYVGLRHLAKQAGRLYDSALYFLWGFLKRPQPRFNFLDPHASVPQEYGEVIELRKKLVMELKRRGVDPAQFDYSFARCLEEDAKARADEQKRIADAWEESQRKHL